MSTRQKESVTVLKMKIEELEKTVADYKRRLDDLRKAKNTTIVKREREVLEVGGPNLGQREASDARVAELEKRLEAAEKRRVVETGALQKRLDAHLERLKEEDKGGKKEEVESDCGHGELILALQAENAALLHENLELHDQVSTLQTDLSIKEANWCDQEEKLKLKLKQSWGEKYQEWMAATEQKMEELQHANNLMRQMLSAQRSGGAES